MSSAPVLIAAALAAVAVLVIAAGVAPALTPPARSPRPSATGRRHHRGRFLRPWSRRPLEPDELAVAAWCERVAGAVRGGSSLTQSVVDASLEGGPFEHVTHAIRRGRPLGAAFGDLRRDAGTPIGLAAPVLATCAELGGTAPSALERVAAVLVARATEHDERRTASAQAALSARVLTLVPLAVVALLALTEPSIRMILTTPAGAACLVAGGLLDLLGWWWMRRMIGATP